MQKFANPTVFLKLANAILPYLWVITAALFALGLYGAFVTSPADYQQGESVRIMYIHVPASWIAMFAYALMAFVSAIAIIFRHPLADAAAKTAAPIGAVFCFLALATGAIWGKPLGAPIGYGMPASPQCLFCSCSMLVTSPSGRPLKSHI